MTEVVDHLIIGAGIVGLTCALELKRRDPRARIVVLEKEPEPGRHSSGRNSGVLHSGIYYPPGSLKARVCSAGAREMAAYCHERGLPLLPLGKLLVPVRERDGPQLDLLESRAGESGISVERIDERELRRREPEARSATGEALFVRQTSVVDSAAVLAEVVRDVRRAGIEIRCGGTLGPVDEAAGAVGWAGSLFSAGHVLNAAGLHADTVAHRFGVGHDMVLLPFKGLYWKLDPTAGIRPNHLIYPVPDLRVPFLGIHTTTAVNGTVYIGPTSVPAFGREHYRGLAGVEPRDLGRILRLLAGQFASGHDGFRRLAIQEGSRYFKASFASAARRLLPRLRARDLLPTDKVGIRAQMLDTTSGRLVTDFVVRSGPRSTHVLNAISPAFTSAFPLARVICDAALENEETHANQR
jgi:(S)-2-hydroxyglutarate dehydrogenase